MTKDRTTITKPRKCRSCSTPLALWRLLTADAVRCFFYAQESHVMSVNLSLCILGSKHNGKASVRRREEFGQLHRAPDHAVGRLLWDDEVAAISAEDRRRFNTVLMRRKTYKATLRLGMTSHPNVKNYVFSRAR